MSSPATQHAFCCFQPFERDLAYFSAGAKQQAKGLLPRTVRPLDGGAEPPRLSLVIAPLDSADQLAFTRVEAT